MSDKEIACMKINEGDASRYIRPGWVEGGLLSTAAFDLRDGDPPETFVSHFMAQGASAQEKFRHAYALISARIKKCDRGGIALLDVSEVLEEVNDENQALVEFRDAGLPHCGLHYLTADPQDRLEIKTVLCLIATKRMARAASVCGADGLVAMLSSEHLTP